MTLQITAAVFAAGVLLVALALRRETERVAPNESPLKRRDKRANQPPVFSVRGFRKDYPGPTGPVTAVRNVNIDIHEGVTAIVGPSGGGKTTTLNCLGGLDKPTSGKVWVRGVLLDFDNAEAMRRHRGEGVAWVFQDLNLISHQSVVENVALPLLCRGVKRREALATAQRMLDCLEIGHLAGRSREQLSRGQQQRVAVARAFASNAAVVLADEPTGSLDPETAETVMQAFRWMSHDEGKPVVLVTHNHELARNYSDRVLLCTPDGLCDLTDGTSAKALPQAFPPDAGARRGESASCVPPCR